MINLDQVRTLEWKVKQAVQLIAHLRRENDTLRGRLSDTEVRLQELESLLEAFKATQSEMESGIRSALEELDQMEGGDGPFSGDDVQVDSFVLPQAVVTSSVEVPSEPEDSGVVPEDKEGISFTASSEEGPGEESISDEVETEATTYGAAESDDSYSPEEFAPPKPALEDKEPEQPGLGIF